MTEDTAGPSSERTLSLLRAALDSTADGILGVDLSGKTTLYNERFVTMWQVPSSVVAAGVDHEAIAAVLDQLVDPEAFVAKVRSLYAEPEAESVDVLWFKDGRVFERYSQPQRLAKDNEIVGRVWSFRDVTEPRRVAAERDRMLEEHRASLASAALMAGASSALVSTFDYETSLGRVARMCVPLMGDLCVIDEVSEKDSPRSIAIASTRPADARGAASASKIRSVVAEVLRTGSLAVKDDRTTDFRSLVSVPLIARGKVIGALTFVSHSKARHGPREIALTNDLATRIGFAIDNARLLHAAENAVRVRDEFASIAAHELYTPLTSLVLLVQGMLAMRSPSTRQEQMRKLLSLAEKQTHRLNRLVGSLLDVTRIEQGRLELALDDVELSALVSEVSERLEPDLTRAGSTLSFEKKGPVFGRWDRLRLEQVVTNLLSNAIKFGQGRPIEVTVELNSETARLTVRDQGIGIDASMHGTIFERFQRAVSTRNFGGLGLGLYICRRIVEDHGGRIWFSSELGAGSTFGFDVPRAGPAPAPTTPQRRPGERRRSPDTPS